MTIPPWIDGAILGFGRSMGIQNLTLNERGVAALTFENGFTLALEYALETFSVSVKVPVEPTSASLKKILVAAHPENRFPFRLRAAYLAKTGRAIFLVKLAERQVTETTLAKVFTSLWQLARDLGGER